MTSSDYLILFGDLIGSTEVASEASPSTFSKLYIASFYLAMKCAKRYIEEPMFPAVPFTKIIEGINLSGDEVFSFTEMTGIDDETKKQDAVASAVAFAFVLSVFWMASPYNIKRLNERKFPRLVALGIHMGPAERILDNPESNLAGLHINVTKRLETAARSGLNSRIFASDDVVHIYSRWLNRHRNVPAKETPPLLYSKFNIISTPLDLKGLPVKLSAFELQINENDQNRLMELLEIIFDTPKHPDVQAEDAVLKLTNFLLDELFSIESLRQQIPNISSPEDYIEYWFKAINPVPNLFTSDLWTLMVTFFISCGFIRRSGLSEENIKEYKNITEKVRLRLRELLFGSPDKNH